MDNYIENYYGIKKKRIYVKYVLSLLKSGGKYSGISNNLVILQYHCNR